MVLTKALVLKGVIGATSVAVPASLMIAYRKEIASHFSPSNLTKFDQGLIDYLENGGDIQFKVVKSGNNNSEENLQDSNFTLTDGSLDVVVKVKVSVNAESGSAIGTLQDSSNSDQGNENNKGKKTTLQQLNRKEGNSSATDWTWICEIKFSGTGDSSSQIKEEKKNLIFKGSNEGLFGILKNSSGEGDNNGTKKKTKINFIKNCAEARENNSTFNMGDDNEIKTPKEKVIFEFQKETTGTNLIPKDEKKFNKWFSQEETASL